jgi:hypothetical protein
MLTNADIMIHSSYDNLSLISPVLGSTTTKANPVFDELQGRGQVSRFLFIPSIHNSEILIC